MVFDNVGVARTHGQALQGRLARAVFVFAEGQQRAESPAGVDAEFAPGHAQPPFARVHKTGLLAAQILRVQGQTRQTRLFGGASALQRKKERGVAAGAPFGKSQCGHGCILCLPEKYARASPHCPARRVFRNVQPMSIAVSNLPRARRSPEFPNYSLRFFPNMVIEKAVTVSMPARQRAGNIGGQIVIYYYVDGNSTTQNNVFWEAL